MGLFIDGLIGSATEAQRPAVERLRESTGYMGAMLDDLLEISRLDAQILTANKTPLALRQVFDHLAAIHADQAAATATRIVWRDRGLAVNSDAALLVRMAGNLVVNALHHAAGGRVMVLARRRGASVRIEVRDNGPGIAGIHQKRVFEEFYQVANVERDRRKGFGLGLSICARIAHLLDTQIELRSAAGKGTTFAFGLQAADPASVVASTPAAVQPGPLPGRHCLVVDDDPLILDATEQLLVQWGCSVQRASSSAEALAALSHPDACFHAVLCDLQLGGTRDGVDVIEQARKLQPDALSVVVSGATGPQDLRRLRTLGITLLTKPVAPAKLRAMLGAQRKPLSVS